MTYLFLDTNIYIHFRDFEEINWKKELSIIEDYIIVLAPIVIDELDKHKYNQNQKISRRIKKLLPKIELRIDEKKIILLNSRPKTATFDQHKLDKLEQDDSLLASIIEFRQEINHEHRIIYITNDTGPRLKAKTLQIDAQKIPEEYLIDNDDDEVIKENRRLKTELIEIKNLRPIIRFGFENGKENFVRPKNVEIKNKSTFIKEFMLKEERKYNFLEKEKINKDELTGLDLISKMYSTLTDKQVDTYNSNLKKYFQSFENYLDSIYDQKLYDDHLLILNLTLDNTGNKPAEDVDVILKFPNHLKVINKNKLRQIAKTKPVLPKKPIPNPLGIDYLVPYYPQSELYRHSYDVNYIILNNNVHFHTKSIKHNQKYDLSPVFIKYEDVKEAKPFKIEYKIQISNLPKQIEGMLNINFE